jgi:hypothetical protein
MALIVPKDSPAFRLVPATQSLTTRAAELNKATKRLTQIVEDIELGLQKLNLGISCFVQVASPEGDETSEISLGYKKFNGRWGLVIRESAIASGADADPHKDVWFLDAPRDVRIRAITHVTDLFNKLSADAEAITEALNKNLVAAETLARLISVATSRDSDTEPGVKK